MSARFLRCLRVDERIDHLLGITIDGRQVHAEIYAWRTRCALDVHQAIHSDIVAGERTTDVQVTQRHAIHDIFGLQVEWGAVRVATKRDGTAWHKLEVLLDDVLDGQLIYAVIYDVVAEHIERALVEVVGSDHTISI